MESWIEVGALLYGAILWGLGVGWALADYWLHEGPWFDIRYHRKEGK